MAQQKISQTWLHHVIALGVRGLGRVINDLSVGRVRLVQAVKQPREVDTRYLSRAGSSTSSTSCEPASPKFDNLLGCCRPLISGGLLDLLSASLAPLIHTPLCIRRRQITYKQYLNKHGTLRTDGAAGADRRSGRIGFPERSSYCSPRSDGISFFWAGGLSPCFDWKFLGPLFPTKQ